MTRNEPPAPYAWQLMLHVTHGEQAKATALLAALNRIQRAFGKPLYTMPAAFVGPMEGLETWPAVTAVVERDLRFTMGMEAKRRAAA